MVRPEAIILVVPQALAIKPVQSPVNRVSAWPPRAVGVVITGFVLWATNLYHTSALNAVPHPGTPVIPSVYVEPVNVPDTAEQLEPGVNNRALAQRSFE